MKVLRKVLMLDTPEEKELSELAERLEEVAEEYRKEQQRERTRIRLEGDRNGWYAVLRPRYGRGFVWKKVRLLTQYKMHRGRQFRYQGTQGHYTAVYKEVS